MYRGKNVLFEEYDCATATYIELDSGYLEVNNLEFDLVTKTNAGGISDPGKAQCSAFRSGLCQVAFSEF